MRMNHETFFAPEDKRQGSPGEHTVVSVGQGPETRRGGGGGGEDLTDATSTLPDEAQLEEEELFRGPQQENA